MTKLYNSKVHYLAFQACKKGNSKNGRFVYEIIGEAKPEMELLEVLQLVLAGGNLPPAPFSASEPPRRGQGANYHQQFSTVAI